MAGTRAMPDFAAQVLARLDFIERLCIASFQKEKANMALGKVILDAVAAETNVVDSFIALVRGLVANNTISEETAAAILQQINDERDKVAAAIVENTPTVPAPAPPSA